MGDKGKPSSNIGRDITQKKSLMSLCVGSAGADKHAQGEAVGASKRLRRLDSLESTQ